MFQFGEKVIIRDPFLKSHNKKGVYVGKNKSGQAKVYLEEPIRNGKVTVSCITIGTDKIFPYEEDEKEILYARLTFLYDRANELKMEFTEITEEIFEIEKKLMGI